MQDSNLKYYILVEGAKEGAAAFKLVGDAAKQAAASTTAAGKAAGGGAKPIKDLTNATNENANATDRASKSQENYLLHISKTTVLSALVNKAFLEVVDSIGKAVKQADLISSFPSSMAAIGISTKDASESFNTLRQYVQGTAGDLTLAAGAVSRFAQVNKNVKASVAVYAGVNNALIAGGASAEAQAGALEQLIQAYSRGKFEGEEFKSVNTAASLAMSETAKALGYVSTSSLQDAMREGTVSMNEFITGLTKVSTQAGPISDQVTIQMRGIEFAGNAMKNALVNGLTQIYLAVGRQNIVSFLNFLTQVIGVLFQGVVQLINIFRRLFGLLTGTPLDDITGDTEKSLQGGAAAASDMGKNLDNAGKSAKKLRNQLASFDKMNVLQPPTADKSDSDTGGGTGSFDPGQAKALEDIFGNLGGNLQEASLWAKILAGIIAGIVGIAGLSKLLDWAIKFGKNLGIAWEAGKKVFSALGAIAKWGWNKVVEGVNLLGAYLKNAWQRAKELAGVAWEKTKTAVSNIVDRAKELSKIALDKVKSGFEKIRDAATEAAVKVKDVAKQAITTAATAVKEAAKTAAAWVKAAATAAAAWVKNTAIIVAQFVLTTARSVVQAVLVAAAWVAAAVATAAAWVIANAAMLGIWGLIIAAVIGAVALIIANWDTIVAFFKGVWEGIKVVFNAVVDFLVGVFRAAWEGIKAVWDFVVWYYTTLWNAIVTVFSVVGKFFIGIFRNAWEGIKIIWNAVGGFFRGVWNGIVNIFKGVGKWFGNVFRGAWEGVKRIFGAVGGFFRGVWDKIVSIFGKIGSSIGNAIGNAFKTVVNAIIGFAEGTINTFIKAINGAIGLINKIPGVDIKTLTELKIPRLATGGVVSQPTIAQIGEAGAEAVVPLENNTEWIDKLASKINGPSSSNATPDIIPVTNQKQQPTSNITVNVSGVLATNEQDKRKLAEMIAKQLESQLRAKGMRGAF